MRGGKPNLERHAQVITLLREKKSMTLVAQALGITRERVRQIAKRYGIIGTSIVIPCSFCGEPLSSGTVKHDPDGLHACQACATTRNRVVREQKRGPRYVCASCGDELKKRRPSTSGKHFCTKTKECRAARMRDYYATSEYHRAYTRAHVEKQRERGYFREYERRRVAALPDTICQECGETTGSKHARYCDVHRRYKRAEGNRRRRTVTPHESIVQLRHMLRDIPTMKAIYANALIDEDHLSERKVAELLGVSRSTVNGWHLGTRRRYIHASA